MYSSVIFLAHNNQTRLRIASAPDHCSSTSNGFCLFHLSLHSPSRKLSLNSDNGILSLLWTTLDFLLVIVLYWILLVHKWFFTEDTCMCLCVWRMVMKLYNNPLSNKGVLISDWITITIWFAKNSNGSMFDIYCNGPKPAWIFFSHTKIHLQEIIIIWALCIEKVCI